MSGSPPVTDEPGAGPLARGAWLVALAFVVLELGTGWRYGLFRDELYYLACADHLAWGYVDHPPLSIAVLWAVRGLLGDGLFALRLVPAVAGGGLVLLGAALARELGGSRFAQTLAALAVAIAPQYLAIAGFYSMNVFDLLFWAGGGLVLARLARTGERRLWWALGALVGLGLLNKISLLFFALGLALAVALTPLRRHLRHLEPWGAGLLALLLFAPHLVWQVRHGWPTLEFMANATRYKIAPRPPLDFLLAQIPELHPLNLPLWLGGLGWLFFARAGRRWRALGIVYLAALGVMLGMRSKPYYLGAAYPMLLAAGAVAAGHWLAPAPRRGLRAALLVLLALGGAASAPLAVPVLPVESLVAYQSALGFAPENAETQELGPLAQHFADRFGWREMTAAVERAWRALPEADRRDALIVTDNYGEAGAINYYGRALGLPPAVSQHNSFFLWGPGRERVSVLIFVGRDPEDLRGEFDEIEIAGPIVAPYAMPYETEHPVIVARGLRLPLAEAWQRGKMFI